MISSGEASERGISARSEIRFKGRSMTGVVLCGGQSRRMGRDKALLELDGVPLVQRAAETLSEVCDEVWLASGSEPRYLDLGYSHVLDEFSGAGPLAGLGAALARTPREWIALLACDLPFVDAALFARMREVAEGHDLDACLAKTTGGHEPVCALYRRSCEPFVRASLQSGERRMVAFWEGEARLRVGFLAATSGDAGRNLNTPEDFALALGSGLEARP